LFIRKVIFCIVAGEKMIDRKKYFLCDEYTKNLAKIAAKATTNEELAKLCQRMYIADYINLENLDLWLSKNALTTAFQVLKKYPALRSRLNYFGTLKGFASSKDKLFAFLHPKCGWLTRRYARQMTDSIVSSAEASFQNGGLAMAFFSNCGQYAFSGIILDEDDFDEQKVLEDIRYSSECGYSPMGCVSTRSIVDHELGHLLDYWLDLSNSLEFRSTIDAYSADYIGENLSRYCVEGGVVNYAEVLAEGFSEYRNHGAPRPIAKFIGELIDKTYQMKQHV